MKGLNKLGTGLTVVFSVTLIALIAEIIYVLWHRRRFRQRIIAGGDPEIGGDSFYTPSKELLYFFCWQNRSRIEPAGAPPLPPPQQEEEVDDLAKWQGLYGPSRVLFTIKEEKEDVETENCSSAENQEKTKRECLEGGSGLFGTGIDPEVIVRIEVDEATPFSTPCASPPYYTPSPSPTREVNPTYSVGNEESAVLGFEIESVQNDMSESEVSGHDKVSSVDCENITGR